MKHYINEIVAQHKTTGIIYKAKFFTQQVLYFPNNSHISVDLFQGDKFVKTIKYATYSKNFKTR